MAAMMMEGTTGGGGDAWESHELVNRYLQHAFQHAFQHALGLGGTGVSGSGKQRRPQQQQQHSTSLDYACHHPLLLLDKPHTPPAIRQRLLEIMFETHDLPAVFFLRDAIASCYAVGRTTATVVDVGYSSTMVTPVYEGFVETRGVLRKQCLRGEGRGGTGAAHDGRDREEAGGKEEEGSDEEDESTEVGEGGEQRRRQQQ